VDVLNPDRFHTLQEKASSKAAAGDLIDNVLFGFLDPDSLKPFGKILVA
jgi:hypothetical protein